MDEDRLYLLPGEMKESLAGPEWPEKSPFEGKKLFLDCYHSPD